MMESGSVPEGDYRNPGGAEECGFITNPRTRSILGSPLEIASN